MQQVEGLAAPRAKWLVAGAAAVLLGIVLRSAWVTEDAYITLRTVDNLVNGRGLRWNVAERVQGYTHPLWMFLLSAFYFVTREDFFTTVIVGFGTTAAALAMLIKLARSAGHALVALLLLSLSISFTDYSTSGLENPLSHLLIAAFIYLYAVREAGLRELALTAALIALNRTDAVLVVAPALVHEGIRSLRARGFEHTARESLLGLSPYFAWEAFSVFYYGFAFPNTAYAKLNTGIPSSELARQGLTYFLNTYAWDSAGVLGMCLGLGFAASSRRLRDGLIAVGVALYLLYVLRVGGDFMLGRFMTIPLFAAVCLLAISERPLSEPTVIGALLIPFLLLFFQPRATDRFAAGDFVRSGSADEHAVYRDGASMLMFTRSYSLPHHSWYQDGENAAAHGEKVNVIGNVGFRGFASGPGIYIIDWHALTDPLLARLPARHDPAWRVGHYKRDLPKGYFDTVATGKCVMEDANLCIYYENLREIISGDLFSFSRLATIFNMSLGRYDHLIDKERYRYPDRLRVVHKQIAARVEENAPFDGPNSIVFQHDGIDVALDAISHAKRIRVMLDGNDKYEIEYRLGTEVIAEQASPGLGFGFMHERTLVTPKAAAEHGFDRLIIRPTQGDGLFAVGYLRLR